MGYLQEWGGKIAKLNPVKTAQQKQADETKVQQSQNALLANKGLLEAELARKAATPQKVQAQNMQAATAAAPIQMQPSTITGRYDITAPEVSGSAAENAYQEAVRSNQLQRSRIGQVDSGGRIQGMANVDTALAQQSRAAQEQLLARLMGEQVEPTEQIKLLQKAGDKAIAQQVGMAAASRGNPALAQRQAMINQTDIAGDVAGASAALSEQQRIKNMELASTLAGGMRAGDMQGGELQLKAQLANMAAQEAEKSRAMEAQITNAGYDFQVIKANADAGNAAAQELLANARRDAEAKMIAQQQSAQNAIDIGQFNVGQVNQARQFDIQQAQQSGQYNASQLNEMMRFNEQLRVSTELANIDAQLKARGVDDARRLEIIQMLSGLDSNALQNEMQRMGIRTAIDTANTASRNAMTGAILQGAAGVGATALQGGVFSEGEQGLSIPRRRNEF